MVLVCASAAGARNHSHAAARTPKPTRRGAPRPAPTYARAEAATRGQVTASLIAFTGLARTPLLAGLAANFCFSFVNGLIPSRAGRAGFFTTTNLAKSWNTNTPFFFSSL